MRCVSYTRTTSCSRKQSIPVFTVAEQNEHVREYVRSNELKLRKKYSDRKDDPAEISDFENMRQDGLNRKFDLLIFDSFWQCGKDIFSIVRVLKDAFVPAGINFAVVQDNYCSTGRDVDEIYEYLESAWSMYRSHLAEVRMAEKPNVHFVETYGYRYDRANDELMIDEDSAAIVRQIFSKLMLGMKPREIAEELTSRGIENPGDYLCRTKGWTLRGNNRGWGEGTVSHIAKNPKFAGRWEMNANGKNYADDVDPIIEPEVFDEVQKIFAQRRHHCKNSGKRNNPFLKMLTDEETGAKVIMKKNGYTGIYDFHFQPRKPEGVRYEKTHMDYHEAVDQMRRLLKEESGSAAAAAEYIDSCEAQYCREKLIEEKRNRIPDLLSELLQINCKGFMIDELNKTGEVDEAQFAEDMAEIDLQRQIVADEITGVYGEITEIELCYSKDNPWIRLFSQYDEKHELTRSYLKLFCEHVKMWRFETIKPVFREIKWKNMIAPAATEVFNGTEK